MSVNFETATTVIMALPKPKSACAAQELITWIDSKQLNRTIFQFSEGKIQFSDPDFSHEALMHTAARIAAVVFIFPAIGTLSATYNAGAGVLKIGLGIVTFMRGDSSTSENQIKEGLQHLLTAIYDFALTIFTARILIAIGYAINPAFVKSSHEKVEVGYKESKTSSQSDLSNQRSFSSPPSEEPKWRPSMIEQAADSIYTATLSQQSSLAGWVASRQAQS